MKLQKVLAYGLCLLLVASMSSGCKRKKVNVDTDTKPVTQKTNTGEGMPSVDLEATDWTPATGVNTIYFDYDSSALRPDALKVLAENAKAIQGKPAGMLIRIEGSCDERGTQEYNLALGERRAQAVRTQLISLGVPSDRLVTVSFGEEQPAVQGHDESAWSKNRRADFSQSVPKK